jgi:hypothetical protein
LRQEKRRGVFLTCETPIAPWIWMARSMRFCEEKRISALTFPYVCPEPVLVKYSFSLQNGAKDAFPYLCHLRDQRLYDREQLTCARVGIACPVTASHTDDRVQDIELSTVWLLAQNTRLLQKEPVADRHEPKCVCKAISSQVLHSRSYRARPCVLLRLRQASEPAPLPLGSRQRAARCHPSCCSSSSTYAVA